MFLMRESVQAVVEEGVRVYNFGFTYQKEDGEVERFLGMVPAVREWAGRVGGDRQAALAFYAYLCRDSLKYRFSIFDSEVEGIARAVEEMLKE